MMNSNIIDFVTLFFSISAFILATIAYFRTKPNKKKMQDIASKREKLKDEDFSGKKKKDEPAEIDTEEFNPFD